MKLDASIQRGEFIKKELLLSTEEVKKITSLTFVVDLTKDRDHWKSVAGKLKSRFKHMEWWYWKSLFGKASKQAGEGR